MWPALEARADLAKLGASAPEMLISYEQLAEVVAGRTLVNKASKLANTW